MPLAPRIAAYAGFFTAGALAGAVITAAQARPPEPTAKVLVNIVTEELRWAKTNVRLNLDTWQAGAETGTHQHPGPTLIYVLDGELEETWPGGTRTLTAGAAVWNAGRRPHDMKNRTDRPARAVAVHLDPAR